jgi:transmembrane sensor
MPEHQRRDWQRLGATLEPDWTASRASEIKMRIELRKREWKRRQKMITAASVFMLASVMAGGFYLFSREGDTASLNEKSAARNSSFRVSEKRAGSGSGLESQGAKSATKPVATAVTSDAKFQVEEDAQTSTYRIISGAVRFDTGGNNEKSLKVKTGDVLVEDVGTVFTVEALADERARVEVLEGRVLVTWPDGQRELGAGDNALFPPDETVAIKGKSKADEHSPTGSSPSPDWRLLARNGDFVAAFRMIDKNPSAILNRVEDLLLAADVMRLSGRPKQAVYYLEKIIKEHNADPRSNLAAFTVGRVFLDELGSPGQAARAFAIAGRAGSPLAEEALAREVEAWSRAGEVDRARAAASIYVKKYPSSARIEVVRAFGGI